MSRELSGSASDGPWLESSETPSAPTLDVRDSTTALTPLRVGGRLMGLLVITSPDIAGENDHRALSAAIDFSPVVSALVGPLMESDGNVERIRAEIRQCIQTRAYTPNFQPIVELATERIVGYEALTRWSDGTRPDLRFAQADSVGMGIEL